MSTKVYSCIYAGQLLNVPDTLIKMLNLPDHSCVAQVYLALVLENCWACGRYRIIGACFS